MIRLFLFLLLVLALGFGFAWFADRPGEVTLVWQGTEFQASLMVVITALVVLVATILITWWVVSVILRSPSLMRRFYRNRQRDRGYYALSQGLIAASSGDSGRARKLATDSRRLLGNEPLVQLLDAQTFLLEGDRTRARERFSAMLDDDDTKLVALRGLYLEAEREGEKEASKHYAEEAQKLAPAIPWAANAVLKHKTLEGDFEAALRTLESQRAAGMVGKEEAARKRAVLLTAQAMAEEQAHPDQAAKLAAQAHKLSPALVPAAVVGARAYARLNDLKRGANLLEAAWKREPHPDVAQTYVHLRHGDSGMDRLKRARKLAAIRTGHPEGAMALAEAAMAVQDWSLAREAMKPVILANPSQRACSLMAEIEEGQYGDKGRMRDWLARAVRAPRDPVWIADGYVSDHWLPLSPVTGELDAFEWKMPVAMIGGPLEADDLTDLAAPMAPISEPESGAPVPATPMPATPMDEAARSAMAERPAEVPQPAAEPVEAKAASESRASVEAAPVPRAANGANGGVTGGTTTGGAMGDAAMSGEKELSVARHNAVEVAEPVQDEEARSFPAGRAPDDPGVDPDEPAEEKKPYRLF